MIVFPTPSFDLLSSRAEVVLRMKRALNWMYAPSPVLQVRYRPMNIPMNEIEVSSREPEAQRGGNVQETENKLVELGGKGVYGWS